MPSTIELTSKPTIVVNRYWLSYLAIVNISLLILDWLALFQRLPPIMKDVLAAYLVASSLLLPVVAVVRLLWMPRKETAVDLFFAVAALLVLLLGLHHIASTTVWWL